MSFTPKAKIPAPFQRPSVNIDVPVREWRETTAGELRLDDIVAQQGRVTEIVRSASDLDHLTVYLGDPLNVVKTYHRDDPIFAFTEAR